MLSFAASDHQSAMSAFAGTQAKPDKGHTVWLRALVGAEHVVCAFDDHLTLHVLHVDDYIPDNVTHLVPFARQITSNDIIMRPFSIHCPNFSWHRRVQIPAFMFRWKPRHREIVVPRLHLENFAESCRKAEAKYKFPLQTGPSRLLQDRRDTTLTCFVAAASPDAQSTSNPHMRAKP